MSLLEANQQIGNYRVVRKVGSGGMGEIWEAEQTQIGSRVALKVLLPKYSHEHEITARFFNEARAVNVIGHPSLVQIFDIGTLPSGSCYIVMEYLQGETLGKRIARMGRLGVDAIRIARQTASALAAAHGKGIIHRDLKPDNLFLVGDPEAACGERVKVLDFGIAKMVRRPSAADAGPAPTAAEVFMGTPQYMSPEQCRGAGSVEEKSDVYSLGIILFEMLSGSLPFPDSTPVGEVIAHHLYGKPPSLIEIDRTINLALSDLVDSMLAKQPSLRPSMGEVVQRLEDLGAPKATGPVPRISWGPHNRTPVLSSRISMLGTSSGERTGPRGPKGSNRLPMVLITVALLGLSVTAGSWLSRRRSPPARTEPAAGQISPRTPDASRNQDPLTSGAAKPQELPPALAAAPLPVPDLSAPPIPTVHWEIASYPAAAEVLDRDSGQIIGTTPLDLHRTARLGVVRLRLRLKGYKDKELVLDEGQDYRAIAALERQPSGGARPRWQKDASDTRLIPLFPQKSDPEKAAK